MAGRLGGVNRTIQNLEVIKTIKDENLIIVKGSVPGPKGLCVTVFDSVKSNKELDLPYPSHNESSQLNQEVNETKDKHGESEETSSVDQSNQTVIKEEQKWKLR